MFWRFLKKVFQFFEFILYISFYAVAVMIVFPCLNYFSGDYTYGGDYKVRVTFGFLTFLLAIGLTMVRVRWLGWKNQFSELARVWFLPRDTRQDHEMSSKFTLFIFSCVLMYFFLWWVDGQTIHYFDRGFIDNMNDWSPAFIIHFFSKYYTLIMSVVFVIFLCTFIIYNSVYLLLTKAFPSLSHSQKFWDDVFTYTCGLMSCIVLILFVILIFETPLLKQFQASGELQDILKLIFGPSLFVFCLFFLFPPSLIRKKYMHSEHYILTTKE